MELNIKVGELSENLFKFLLRENPSKKTQRKKNNAHSFNETFDEFCNRKQNNVL